MTASVSGSTHPGLKVGSTSEFSLFFHVKPGMGTSLRKALLALQNTPGYRPGDYGIAIQTIHEARFVLFDEDTRQRAEIDYVVEEMDVKGPELDMARQLVASLVGDFAPDEFENEYRRELRAMLEAKLAGEEIAVPEPVETAPVVDLMEALKQSVAQAQKSKGADGKAPAKKAPARKERAASASR